MSKIWTFIQEGIAEDVEKIIFETGGLHPEFNLASEHISNGRVECYRDITSRLEPKI